MVILCLTAGFTAVIDAPVKVPKLHVVIYNKFWQGYVTGAPFIMTEWYQGKSQPTTVINYMKKSAQVSNEYKFDSVVIQEQ